MKLPLYAEAGVAFVWLVDPERRRAEIFESKGGESELVQVVDGDAQVILPPFASRIELSRWWVTRPEG